MLNYIEAIDVLDGNLEAFDAEGRSVGLSAESDRGPIIWALRDDRYPVELRDRLAAYVRKVGPLRLGLIDADLDLDGLLRALWRADHRNDPYPRDIAQR